MAHQSSGSDCGSLLEKIGTEGVKLLQKSWDVIKARIRKNNAEGFFAKRAADIAYVKAGVAWKLQKRKVDQAWSHWNEHCVVRRGFLGQ